MREALVAFMGNELCIGTILAGWFLGVTLGASAARFLVGRVRHARQCLWGLASLSLVLGFALPVQVYALRIVRSLLGVPMGEYAPFGAMLAGSLLIFLPSSFCVGMAFPLACRAVVPPGPRHGGPAGASAVSMIYTLESMGSAAGGVLLTYLLIPVLSPYAILALAAAVAAAGAALLAPHRGARRVLVSFALCVALLTLFFPKWMSVAEDWTVRERWRAFGVLRQHSRDGAAETRLIASKDTVYQNLAVTESEGQFALYANGLVQFVFPDQHAYEHSIHFIMAQKPEASRVLLLGANPVGDIPELLKYPIERLVYVELDPGVGAMIRTVAPEAYQAALEDSRVVFVPEDAPRYVRKCREQFDVVLVSAPEPCTASANRFYTLEFFGNISRILAPGGFMCAAVTSSERLMSEAADLGASVHRTLKAVFPVVLVTAEPRNRFFAGEEDAGLTFDREQLEAKSRAAGIRNKYFRPEYFRATDEITPSRTEYVEARFNATDTPPNTNIRPVTYFYNLILWGRFSGSAVESFLRRARRVTVADMTKYVLGTGILALLVGVALKLAGAAGRTPHGIGPDSELPNAGGRRAVWAGFMTCALLSTTGFCGMALEILLVFVFQSLYGYVYTRIGLIMAMFMVGLIAGAPSGRLMASGRRRRAWAAMACLEMLLIALACALPRFIERASTQALSSESQRLVEISCYLVVAVVGWAVGAEFPTANRLFIDAGGSVGAAAAVTDAADHLGAGLGALIAGVLLIPLLGMGGACIVLAAMKCAGLMFLGSALLAMPGESCPRS